MNLDNLILVELNAQEAKEVDGGYLELVITGIGLAGAACAWAWEKGEALGKSIA